MPLSEGSITTGATLSETAITTGASSVEAAIPADLNETSPDGGPLEAGRLDVPLRMAEVSIPAQ